MLNDKEFDKRFNRVWDQVEKTNKIAGIVSILFSAATLIGVIAVVVYVFVK